VRRVISAMKERKRDMAVEEKEKGEQWQCNKSQGRQTGRGATPLLVGRFIRDASVSLKQMTAHLSVECPCECEPSVGESLAFAHNSTSAKFGTLASLRVTRVAPTTISGVSFEDFSDRLVRRRECSRRAEFRTHGVKHVIRVWLPTNRE